MYEYKVYDMLTRQELGRLDLTNVTFGEPLMDAGQLQGSVSVSADSNIDLLKTMLDVNRGASCIYVFDGSSILWSGIIQSAPWPQKSGVINITAVHIEQYLTEVFHGITTIGKKWTATEQLQIARELIAYVNTRPGTPQIKVGTQISGITRDLSVAPQSYVDIAELINSMATRDDGFQWRLAARLSSSDGLPEWYFETFYPERQSLGETTLVLRQSPDGGNIISRSDWPNDATNRRTRIYATGDGEAPATMVATDEDPGIAEGTMPLREKVTNYAGQGITDPNTLADHARNERNVLSHTTGTISVDVPIDNPPVGDYIVGDRTRLVLKDEWLDVDLPDVRIVDKTIRDEDRDSTAQVTLTLDISGSDARTLATRPEWHMDLAYERQMRERIRALERKGLSIPLISGDVDATSRTNIWIDTATGKLRWRDNLGVPHDVTTGSGAGGGTAPPVTTYTKTYSATFTRSYADGSYDSFQQTMNHGKSPYGTVHTYWTAQMGFPYSTIATDLSGATIKKVEVYFDPIVIYTGGGVVTVYIGTHTNATGQSTYNNVNGVKTTHADWSLSAAWKTVSNSIGTSFKAGTIKGLTLDPATSSYAYYCAIAGNAGAGSPPKLRITYTK